MEGECRKEGGREKKKAEIRFLLVHRIYAEIYLESR